MAPASKSPNKAKFNTGEKVLCKHREQLYDAIIKKFDCEKVKPYQVHYQNWSKNWDEWVEDHRICKVTESNRKLQEELRKKVGKVTKSKKKNTFTKPKPRKETPVKTDQVAEKPAEPATAQTSNNLKIEISVPSSLNYVMTNDYNFISEHTSNSQNLYQLPVKFPISEIMNDFMLTGKDRAEKSCFKEYKGTIQVYFDYSLKRRVLYAQENQQYEENFGSKTKPSVCYYYGIEHLLRFFTIFPSLLSASKSLEQKQIDQTKETTDKFFPFLEANINTYLN